MVDPIQIINNTGTVSLGSEGSALPISIIAVAVTLLIGIVTIAYSKKQHKRNALTDVFSLLNTPEHKEAEHELREAYKENKLYSMNEINDDFITYYDIVRRNYSQIGVMINEGVIPSRAYYVSFGVITVISYIIVQEAIKHKKMTRPLFMAHFHNLAYDCLNFWIEEDMNKIHPITDPKTNQEISLERIGKKVDAISRKKFPWS